MTDEELKVLAVDIVDRRVFGSWMVPKDQPSLIARIFLPLSVGAASKRPGDASCFYEYLDRAMPISVNGYPAFFSFKFLTVEDWERLVPMIERYKSMKQEFLDWIEPQVDLILSHLGLDPYRGVNLEVIELMKAGQKIQAIKLYREQTGVGLKAAKDYVESL